MEKQKNIKRYLELSVVILLLGCEHVATSPGLGRSLTNIERKKFLNAHNDFRRDASMEFQGTKQPSAGNMKRLYWNAALEADAFAWAWHERTLEYVHKGHSSLTSQKEFKDMLNTQNTVNIGQNSAGDIEDPTRLVISWYAQTNLYTFKNNVCSSKASCNHFTQVMWADTMYIGCSIFQADDTDSFTVCNYYPAGNLKGMRPYKEGENCSLCGTLKKDGFTECDKGLCQPRNKCSPVKECKVVDTVNCLCSEDDYNGLFKKLVKATGLRLASSSLLLLLSVVVGLFISPIDIA